jgi:hypothetical protein
MTGGRCWKQKNKAPAVETLEQYPDNCGEIMLRFLKFTGKFYKLS